MKIFLKYFFIVTLLHISHGIYSQYYDLGQDPASIKWKQINTKNFQIIYPEGSDSNAQYFANILDTLYVYASKTLEHQPKKISIIFHNKTVVSNGIAILAPKRIEVYTCPSQDSYAQNWFEQLAIHEYRHVVQFDKLNQGITKLLNFILGQQATAGVLGLFVPNWFTEGDAVCTETALSNSGRGRIPNFEMKLKAQVLEKGRYSYDKAVYGSYKDFTPDNYELGYQLVADARKNYGAEIWSNTLNIVAKYPFIITPFSKGIKKISGLSKERLYKKTIMELDSLWSENNKNLDFTSFSVLNKPQKFYTNYNHAHYIGDSLILTEKSGIDDINRFVTTDRKGTEKIIFTPGLNFKETMSYKKGMICWAEKTFDPRWNNRNYSVIKSYNIKTEKLSQITFKTRFFSPDLSDDGKRIAAVEVTEQNEFYLVILDAVTGEVLKKFSNPENLFYMTPSWSEDGNKIISIVLGKKGKSIAIIDNTIGTTTYMIPFSYTEISKPIIHKNYILYTAAYSGTDNIYALDILTNKIFQITSSKFGAINPDISDDGKKMIYSDYTSDGYRTAEAEFNTDNWISLEKVKNNSLKLYDVISKQEKGVLNSESIGNKTFDIRPYRKWQHLLNIHSWAPVSIDIDNTTMKPGFCMMSQDKLSTTFLTLGYEYNRNDKTGIYYADLSYKGLYPVIYYRAEYGERAGYYIDTKERYTWNETDMLIGSYVPLDFTHGKYYYGFRPQISTSLMGITHTSLTPENFVTGKIQTLNYRFLAYNQIRTSEKDLEPTWAQIIDFNYKYTPFSSIDLGHVYSLKTDFYFPGLLKHHSFKIQGAFQERQRGDSYYFSGLINYPRGYYNQSCDSLYTLFLDYKFPMLYPDFRIGSLVYIKRLKINLFYDYAYGKSENKEKYYNSFGAELTSDMHILRFIAPIDIGFRYSYLPELKTASFDFLFAINFNSLY